MTSQRCADRDLRRLEVADLTNHHDVRISTQNRPQGIGKGEADLRLHRDLHHASEFVFHRILDRDDATLGVIHFAEEGIKARRFSGSRRTGDEDDAIGQVKQGFDFFLHEGLHAELREIEFFLVEQTQ